MTTRRLSRIFSLAVAGAALAAVLSLAPFGALSASASISGCRGEDCQDPILVLQGGGTVKITTNVKTPAFNLSSEAYEVHLPSDAAVTAVIGFSTSNYRVPTTVDVYYDNPAQTYSATVTVTSNTGSVYDVEETMTVTLGKPATTNAKGQTGQALPVALTYPAA